MDNSSGVGVLDKAALVLSALESGPATLAGPGPDDHRVDPVSRGLDLEDELGVALDHTGQRPGRRNLCLQVPPPPGLRPAARLP